MYFEVDVMYFDFEITYFEVDEMFFDYDVMYFEVDVMFSDVDILHKHNEKFWDVSTPFFFDVST